MVAFGKKIQDPKTKFQKPKCIPIIILELETWNLSPGIGTRENITYYKCIFLPG
jgi:hypothetical protein